MLRFVARVLIARQHDLCCTALGGASDVVPKFVWPTDSAAQWTGAREVPAFFLLRQLSHRREVRCRR
jgi:hypothetical protein